MSNDDLEKGGKKYLVRDTRGSFRYFGTFEGWAPWKGVESAWFREADGNLYAIPKDHVEIIPENDWPRHLREGVAPNFNEGVYDTASHDKEGPNYSSHPDKDIIDLDDDQDTTPERFGPPRFGHAMFYRWENRGKRNRRIPKNYELTDDK